MWLDAQGSGGGVDCLHEGSCWGEWGPNLNPLLAAQGSDGSAESRSDGAIVVR